MKEKEEKRIVEEGEGANKRDFLKVLGAGLGIAGLSSMMGGQSFAQEDKKGKYVIVITHGGNDPNRAIFGLLMAQTVADKGWGRVHVWMTLDGADLVNKKKTERIESPIYKKFGNALEIMEKIKEMKKELKYEYYQLEHNIRHIIMDEQEHISELKILLGI